MIESDLMIKRSEFALYVSMTVSVLHVAEIRSGNGRSIDSTPARKIYLVFNQFIFVLFRSYGKYQVTAAIHAVAGDIMYSIIKNHIIPMVVSMGGRAELYSRIFGDITVKHFGYIVIEYVRIGARVHANYRLFKLVPSVLYLLLHKSEIRNGFGIIIFQCIGIQADKLHIARNEREIGRAEYGFLCFFPCAEAVMISNQDHIRYFKSIHNISLPKKLFRHSEVTHVSAMNDEINIIPFINLFHKLFRLVIPAL